MKLLSIDTATEQCSAAISIHGQGAATWSRVVATARAHADLILPMVDELLAESKLALADLDGLAFGRGPGSFTGVRIAVSVVQGLALACNRSVVGVSDLAAVARQAALKYHLPPGAQVLVCMDARMHEVYWAQYSVLANGWVILVGVEQVAAPDRVQTDSRIIQVGAGTGWKAYPELRNKYGSATIDDTLLPRAVEIGELAWDEFKNGRVITAAEAQPVYLRDQVVTIGR